MSERLVLTHGCSLSNLPLFAAEGAGFFADEGLSVEAPAFRMMSSTAELLATGVADLGTAAFTQPLIDSVRDNPPVLVAGSGLRGVFVLGQAGMSSVEDLRGKVVGTFRGDPLEVLLYDVLAAAGMTMADVHIQYLDDIPAAIASFAAGELDGVTFAEPHATRARASGAVDLSDGRDLWGTEFPDTVLVASAALMRDRPEVVPAAIRAMLLGEQLVHDDYDGAVRLAAKQFPGFAHEELLVAARNQPPCVDVRPYVDTIFARWPSLQALGLVPAGLPVPTAALSLELLSAELDKRSQHDLSAI